MKIIAAVLLVCLLFIGTVSAVSLNIERPQVELTVVPGTTQTQKIAGGAVPGPDLTLAGRGMLEVYSVPSGATVTLSGYGDSAQKTPIKYSLFAGTYTVTVSLAGYQDYTETFSLDAGAIKDINADLKKIDININPAVTLVGGTLVTFRPGNVITLASPASTGRSTPGPTGLPVTVLTPGHIPDAVTRVTTTPVPWACPNADWFCLTPAEAEQQFGGTCARYGDDPCGYAQVNNQTAAKYCYMDVNTGGSLSPGVFAASGIKEGADIYIINRTWIEHGVVHVSPAAQKSGEGGTDLLGSIFKIFSDFLGGSNRPESRLDIVGFNPCPEPPAYAPRLAEVAQN